MVPLKKYGKQGPYSSLLTPKRAYLFNFSEKSFIDVPTSGHCSWKALLCAAK
jgi:hypothetical protein